MKTQSFGMTPLWGHSRPTVCYFQFASARAASLGLKDYRENRENGNERDQIKDTFPAAGLDALDIESSDCRGRSKWPDKQGRYWWYLKCKDGRVINDFYWKVDEVQGFPDKVDSERYWFTVHHAPSGTKIEGFSVRPDRVKGYPDHNGNYWSYVQYDECGPIKAWMEEKDRNYGARVQREQEQFNAVAQKEQRAAEGKQQQELEVAAVKKCSTNVMSMWAAPKALIPPTSSSFTSLNIAANEIKNKLPTLSPEELIIARANCSYQAKKPDQLSFDKEDELIVLKQQSNRWWLCESGGLQGLAPSSCLDIISQAATVSDSSTNFRL